MDLVQGQVIKITEIIDKDWYRGETDGKTGIFPASFVRIIDSFPGDVPPDSADLSSYLKNPKRYHSLLSCLASFLVENYAHTISIIIQRKELKV